MSGPPKGFADLADLPEDERIHAVVAWLHANGGTAGVIVDDWPGKPERYTKKLEARGLVVVRGKSPVPQTTLLKVSQQ